MSDKKSKSQGRTRNYATILYLDSCVENWQQILSEQCIPAFVSPLHDKDLNPTGELKKAHYHVMVMFEGVKSVEQVKVIFDLIGGVGCEKINSIRGYSRYLCHLDNPEKVQYNTSDVLSIAGADYISVIGLASDKYGALSEMQDFCDKYNIISFYVLSSYARVNRNDWYRILCDCGTVFMREWLKSKAWSNENHNLQIVDPKTGEILFTGGAYNE